MKIIFKISGAFVLAAVIIFSMAACNSDKDDDDTDGPTYYSGAFKIDKEQVWVQNKEAKKQDDEWYNKFNDDKVINVVTGFSYDTQGKVIQFQKSTGSGKIEKGLLSFEAEEPAQDDLVSADILNSFFKEYDGVNFDPSDVKGTNIIPVTSAGERLNREELYLLNSSIGLESILFIYVDNDCRITGNPGNKYWDIAPQGYYSLTEQSVDLSLKKGWNTVFRKEVFDNVGYDNISMGLGNPNNFKWVLYIQE